ncbi:killer suppression protein HigA [Tatumella sp. OPLPL6]|uniref:type II toxin-antitoxin system RelE/ParE family toxin n=1 Tax=Tatumella sp. OPLPL6 TaxID=1928657 RepID=UPI000C19AFF9|nr:killer suppression protein HigA [Tatumella sp. OPLPL6]PIJ42119.1 killer suppression protein HigA [Tatumella sp. OPLPL6]
MEIGYADKKIEEICLTNRKAVKKLGDICAKKLRTRLSDLEAASNVNELVAGRPHPLKGDRSGQFAVDLHGGYRLVFSPNHDPIPQNLDGSTDWKRVTIICIEFIGDYHE